MQLERLRVFHGSLAQVWNYLQEFYVLQSTDHGKAHMLKHVFYCNSVFTVTIQIELFPERRKEYLKSLLDFIRQHQRADGLESILLTLIYAAHRDGDQGGVAAGLQVWERFARQPSVSGSGPMVFYNTASKRFSFFTARFATKFLSSEDISELDATAGKLEEKAIAIAEDPFHPGVDVIWIKLPQARPREQNHVAHFAHFAHFLTPDDRKMFNLVANSAALIGTFAGAVGAVPVAGFCAGFAGGLKVIVSIDEVFGEDRPDPRQKPTSALDHSDIEPPEPIEVPQEEADSSPVNDADGNDGTYASQEGVGDFGDNGGGDGGGGGGGGGCFVASTPVFMADGSCKAIAELESSDRIMVYYEGQTMTGEVTRIFREQVPETLRLGLEDGSAVVTTPRQRFAVPGNEGRTGFVEARNLTGESILQTKSRERSSIKSSDPVDRPCEVFNLTVNPGHNYFVGESGLLVHNKKIADPGPDEPWGFA